jgi:hypothetical protein
MPKTTNPRSGPGISLPTIRVKLSPISNIPLTNSSNPLMIQHTFDRGFADTHQALTVLRQEIIKRKSTCEDVSLTVSHVDRTSGS